MKFRIKRTEFNRAVKSADITQKGEKGALSIRWLYLQATKGNLIISTTNHLETFRTRIKADIEKSGSVFMNIVDLSQVLMAFTGKELSISRSSKSRIQIESEVARTQIHLPSPKGIDPPKTKKLPYRFTLTKAEFREVYDKCYFAIGENDSRKNLMGLNIKKDPDSARLVFTGADSFRITEFQVDTTNKAEGSIILPKTSLKKISKIFDKSRALKFAYDDNFLAITDGTTYFHAKLIEAEYPNLNRLVHAEHPHHLRFDIAKIRKAFALMKRSTDNDKRAVSKLRLNGNLSVSNQPDAYTIAAETELPCKYTGEDMAIGVNINFFDEALLRLGSKEVTLSVAHPEAPIYLLDPKIPAFKSVVMPVRIKW